MKKIEEIINKYVSYSSGLYRKQIEKQIEESLPEIKEAFIAFYGEKKRVEIEEKFNRMRIIVPPINLSISYKTMRKNIGQYMNDKYLTSFYEGAFESFTIDDDIELFNQEVKDIVIQIRKKIKPYKEMAEKYEELYEKIEERLEEKYYIQFVEFLKDILKKEMNYSDEMLNKIDINNIYDLIQAFKTYCDLFEQQVYFLDLKNSVNFFRNLGIEIPKLNFEKRFSFKQSEDIKTLENIMLSENVKKKFLTIDVAKKIWYEFVQLGSEISTMADIKTVQIFNDCDFSDNNFLGFNGVESANFEFSGSCIPYLLDDNRKKDIGGIIYINPYITSAQTLGETIIHEINHFLEFSSYSHTKQNTYLFKSGWDVIEKNQRHNLTTKTIYRDYELLNEVLNQLITLDVLKNVRKNGIFQDLKLNIYYNAFFILEEFYHEYKDIIIESRQTGNLEIIYDRIGKENFDEIAKLLLNFSKYVYDGFEYNKTVEMLSNGINNDETMIYLQVCQERDRILGNMREYKQGLRRDSGSINIYEIMFILLFVITIFYYLYIF